MKKEVFEKLVLAKYEYYFFAILYFLEKLLSPCGRFGK